MAWAVIWIAGSAVGATGPPAPQPACAGASRLPALRLHLVDRAGLSALTRDALRREAVRPWLAVGAIAAWTDETPPSAAGPGEGEDLYVIATNDAAEAEAGSRHDAPLAAIRFVDGRPTSHITVYAGDLAHRLDEVRLDDRRLGDRPPRLRDGLLGLVLGRAVAHELGHFLLASSAHAPSGLMRASHRLDRLMAPAASGFQVLVAGSPECLVARLDAR
jgi:hypothetical protein